MIKNKTKNTLFGNGIFKKKTENHLQFQIIIEMKKKTNLFWGKKRIQIFLICNLWCKK